MKTPRNQASDETKLISIFRNLIAHGIIGAPSHRNYQLLVIKNISKVFITEPKLIHVFFPANMASSKIEKITSRYKMPYIYTTAFMKTMSIL